MGFWSSIGDAISSAANAVGNAVEDVGNAIGDAASDALDTIGSAIQQGFDWLGDLTSSISWLSGIFKRLGSFFSIVFHLLGIIFLKGALNIAASFFGGLVKIFGGLITGKLALALAGLEDIGSSIGGTILSGLGNLVSAGQTLFYAQNPSRPLNELEKSVLKRVFQDSLALYNIRIVEGPAGLYSLISSDRQFTLDNTIYFKTLPVDSNLDILVHESVHVWQYQHQGVRYSIEAISAAEYYGVNVAYDWEKEINDHKDWPDFNREAEAEIMQDIYIYGALIEDGVTTSGNGAFYDAKLKISTNQFIYPFDNIDYTGFANKAVAEMRGATSWRFSQWF